MVELFSNPTEIDIECQPSYIQIESREMQADPFFCQKRMNVVSPFGSLQATSSFPA